MGSLSKLSRKARKNKDENQESLGTSAEQELSGVKKEDRHPGELRINSSQLSQLVGLIDFQRSVDSPLPENMESIPLTFEFGSELKENNWITETDESNQAALSDKGQLVIQSLLAPAFQAQLVLGSPKEIAITNFYSLKDYEDDSLTIYTYRAEDDLHVLRPGISPSGISDALLAQLLIGPHLEGLDFSLSMDESHLLTYLAILDLIYTRRLKAKINNEAFPILTFTPGEVDSRFEEIRLGEDLLWLSTLVPYLFPNIMNRLDKKSTAKIVAELTDNKYLTPIEKKSYQPSDFTQALSEALLPIISFAAFSGIDENGSGINLGFLIGLNANLVVQFDKDKNNFLTVHMTGMNGVQLSRLLFELGLPKTKSKNINSHQEE